MYDVCMLDQTKTEGAYIQRSFSISISHLRLHGNIRSIYFENDVNVHFLKSIESAKFLQIYF